MMFFKYVAEKHIGLYCEPPTPAVVEVGREVMASPQRCYHHHVCNQVESDICDLLEGKPQPKRLLEELEMQEVVTRAYLQKEKKDEEMKETMTEKEKSERHNYAEKIEDTSSRLRVFWDPWVLPSIKIGVIFDIPKLLSSSSRDYLIKSNQEQVKITDQLLDKYVILFLYALHNDYTPDFTDGTLMNDLRDIYNTHQDEFELVFVAFGKDEIAFDKSFFPMPLLAIPHQDQHSRDSLKEKFGLRGKPGDLNVVLFGPKGADLNTNAATHIEVVGPEGFPFTKEKLDQIYLHEPAKLCDQLLLQKQTPSLTLLLGEYVHTSNLEAKYTVGLYFFELGFSGRDWTSGLDAFRKVVEL